MRSCPVPVLGAALLLLSGCVNTVPDAIEATDSVSATALVLSSWHPGTGVLIDKEERLLLTSCDVLSGRDDIEVVFPIIENGKTLTHKESWTSKAPHVKAKVVCSDTTRGLTVLRLESVPEDVSALRLAAASPEKDASLQFLGAAANRSLAWEPASAQVQAVGPRQFTADKKKLNARMIELNVEGTLAKAVVGGPVLNQRNEVVGILAGDAAQKGPLLCIDVSEVRPVLGVAWRRTAVQAFDQRDYDTAISLCNRALALNRGDALHWNERGAAYSMKELFEKAIADYSEAIKLSPKLALAYRNRASAYYQIGQYQKAVEDCNRALDIMPSYPMAYYTRQLANAKLGKTAQADADARILDSIRSQQPWKVVSRTGNDNYTVALPDVYTRNAPPIGSSGGAPASGGC